MRNAIRDYRFFLQHLATLVPGEFRGLIEVDGVMYEAWHTHTIVLLPHVG